MRNKRKAFIIMIMGLTLSVSLLGCNSKGNVSVDNKGLEEPTEELTEELTEEPIDDDEDTKDEDNKDNLTQLSAKIVGKKSLQVILSDNEDGFFETLAYLYRDGDLVAVQAGDPKGETDIIEFEMPIVEDDIIHVVVNYGWEGVDNTLFVIDGASNVLFVVGADSQLEKTPYSTQSTFVPSTDDTTVPFSIVVDNPYSIHINTDDDWVNQVLVVVRRGDEYLAPQENVLNGKNGETKTTLFVFSEGLLEGDVVEVTVDVGYKYESYGTAVIKDFNYDLPIENP